MKQDRNKGKSIIELPNDYVVIDIETTGYSLRWDEIIEVAAIKVVNNNITDTFSSLVQPSDEIDDFIVELTGIKNSELQQSNKLDDVLPKFKDFISSSILVGHNVSFDINFLYDSFIDVSGYELKNDFIDTLRLARKLLPDLKHHRLDDLLEHYELNDRLHHRALNDCYKTFDIYNCLKQDALLKYSTEEDFRKSFKHKKSKSSYLNLKEITAETDDFDETHPFYGKLCVFTGKLETFTRKEAAQLVVNVGGSVSDTMTKKPTI